MSSHAIESSVGYGEWLHGEAVAAGMVMAANLSDIGADERVRLTDLIASAGLPIEAADVGATKLREAMQLDKKVRDKRLRFILLRSLGEAYICDDVSESRLTGVLSGH